MARKTANQAIDFNRLFEVKAQLARESALRVASAHESSAPLTDATADAIVVAVHSNSTAEEGTSSKDAPTRELVDVQAPAPVPEQSFGTVVHPTTPSEAAHEIEDAVVERATEQATLAPPVTVVSEAQEVAASPPSARARMNASERKPNERSSLKSARTTLVETTPPLTHARQQASTEEPDEVMLRIGMPRGLHERIRASARLEGQLPTTFAQRTLEARTPLFSRSESMASLAKAAREAFVSTGTPHRTDVRMQIAIDAGLHQRLHQLAALRRQTLTAMVTDLFEASVPEM